eukprot:gene31610-42151_t
MNTLYLSEEQKLLNATKTGNLSDVITSISNGVKINWQNKDDGNSTALYWAASLGYQDIAALLIEQGANRNLATMSGELPVDVARQHGHTEIVHLLCVVSIVQEQRLYDAARDGNLTEVITALDKGADANWQNKSFWGWTALLRATWKGFRDIVAILLERGADPNLVNQWGETSLFRAAKLGHVDIAVLLLERGADPDLATTEGKKPIDAAREHGHPDIVNLLCKDRQRQDSARDDNLREVVAALDEEVME